MNVSGMNEADVVRISGLLELAVQNEWYGLAEALRRSRDELREKLNLEWASNELQRITENINHPE